MFDAPPDQPPEASAAPPPARAARLGPAGRRPGARWAADRRAAWLPAIPLRAATLAAAASLGAMIGFGVRAGASLGRLGVVPLRLRGLPEFVSPDRGALGAALLGGAQVAVVGGLWGAAAGALDAALRARGVPPLARLAAAAAVAGLLAAADLVLPAPLRVAGGALAGPERALVAALTVAAGLAATALTVGARREPVWRS